MRDLLNGLSWLWVGLCVAWFALQADWQIPDLIPDLPIVPRVEPIDPSLSGLQCVIIYETNPPQALPAQQSAILTSPLVRGWLNSNCAKDSRNQPLWRFIDKDSEFADPNSAAAKALQRPRDSIPWLIVTNDGRGYEGPLPANVSDMMALLEQQK